MGKNGPWMQLTSKRGGGERDARTCLLAWDFVLAQQSSPLAPATNIDRQTLENMQIRLCTVQVTGFPYPSTLALIQTL